MSIDKIRAKAFMILPLEESYSKGKDKEFYKEYIKKMIEEIREIMNNENISLEDILNNETTTWLERSILLKYLS